MTVVMVIEKKAEYCSKMHTSVSVDWTVPKKYLEITLEDKTSWIFCYPVSSN